MSDRTFQINVIATADTATAYIARLVADVLGPDATIDVAYGPPDECGMVCVVGEAHTG